jgi:putative phosphoribosyl transferase
MLASEADATVCVHQPEDFHAVGAWYVDFRPTSDEEVVRHLRAAAGA